MDAALMARLKELEDENRGIHNKMPTSSGLTAQFDTTGWANICSGVLKESKIAQQGGCGPLAMNEPIWQLTV
jgi:hypothetical protein